MHAFEEGRFRVGLAHLCRQSAPVTLSRCEKSFTARVTAETIARGMSHGSKAILPRLRMRRFPSSLRSCAWIAIYTTSLFFWIPQVSASDMAGSGTSKAGETIPTSTPAASEHPAASEEQFKTEGKFDINRIGQRNVGHGINIYSMPHERALGESMASRIDRGTRFIADRQVNEYISQLGQKLTRNSDAQVILTTKVIDSPDPRIFGLPGGILYVSKGLIMAVDSEAELAALMAHEIAHVAARHTTRLVSRKYAWNIISIPLMYLSGPAAIGTRQIAPLTLRKFSRDAEFEADLLGLEYQYAAGYDPQTFIEALEKLQSHDRQIRERIAKALPVTSKVPLHTQIANAFSNYPPTEERIQRAQAEISELLPSRNDYIVDTSDFQEVKAKLAWGDWPILRRHRAGDGPSNGPVLRRQSEQYDLAGASDTVTKGRLSSVFSYLPVLPH